MKKGWSRSFALLLSLCVALALLCGTAWAAGVTGDVPTEAPTLMETETGTCGDNLTYTLDDAGNLTISGTGEINNASFAYNNRIKKVIIQYGVTSIGNMAFAGCYNLSSVTIPNSVTSIGRSAFIQCTSLTSVTIPNSVTSIEASMFASCTNLTSVTIPNSVISIGQDAFRNCFSLTSVTIPHSVTSIGKCAFYDCNSLTNVNIPDTVNKIDSFAFNGCSNLTSVTIPDGVARIEMGTFSGCKSLSNVTIPNTVTSIEEQALIGCSNMTKITIPESVTNIDNYAFENCTGLTSVSFLGDAPNISNNAFSNVWTFAYFPKNNATWTSEKKQNYGGVICWDGPFEYHRYRADYYLTNQNGIVEPTLFELSPSRTLYHAGEQKGLASTTKNWKNLTNVLDSVDDISKIPDKLLEKKDVYSALILSTFEASTDNNFIDKVNLKQVRMANEFYQRITAFMKLNANIRLKESTKCSDLSTAEREKIAECTKKWLKEDAGIVQKGSKALDIGLDVFDHVTDISEYCKFISSVCTLHSMNETQKQLMRDLYNKCPDSNKDMKKALAECVKFMDAGVDEMNRELIDKFALTAEKNIAQYGVKTLWKLVKAAATYANPYIAVYLYAYDNSKFLCNALLSTDEICEKFFTMEAMLSIERILDDMYAQNRANYLASQTSEDAEILMTTVDLMFQCFDTDCETAYSYVDTVDSAILSWFLSLFRASSGTQAKQSISSLRNSVSTIHKDVLTRWVSGLEYTYPDLYDQYSYLLKVNIKECHATISPDSYTYSGKACKPKVTVDFYGVPMAKDKDYTLSLVDNVNAGEGKVSLTGIGDDYTGTMELPFTIKKAKQTITAKDFTKTLGDSDFSLKAKTSGDGKLTYKSGNTKVATVSKAGKITLKGDGTAKITITAAATNNYKKATKMVTVKVKKLPGTSITKLTNDSGGKLTVTWKKVTGIGGYEVQYSTSSSFKSSKTSKVTGTSLTVSGLTKKKKYYVRVRTYKVTNQKTFYSQWSKKKNITIKK